MDDIELAIHAAWDRVRDDVLGDREELRRRVIRRERPHIGRPIREWCLAVRAGDTRLTEPLVELEPFSALDPELNDGRFAPHEVTLTTAALRKLCAPVNLEGLTLDEAAAKLGVTKMNLVPARIKGTIRARYVEGLGGRWGRPRPLLHAEELNPTKRGFSSPDDAYGHIATFYGQNVPEGICQTIQRVPLERERGPDYRDRRDLHPEHPLNDPGDAPPRRSRRLPLPPPDVDLGAWYKWKGDEYIGYDWRNPDPMVKANYEAHQRSKALAREARRRRYRENPPPSKSKGSVTFIGWRWVCPKCAKRVQVVFCPLPAINLVERYPRDREALQRAGVRSKPRSRVSGFACADCHGVRVLSRATNLRDFWNELIAHLTGGLLYGREVERPQWLTPQRRRPYALHPNAPPAHRRLAVQERLLKGWSYKRIASEMGITAGTVDTHARHIYKQHRVHGRWELARQLGVPLTRPITKGEQIRHRLADGQTYNQIAAAMGMTYHCVKQYAYEMRHQRNSRQRVDSVH